MFSFLLTALNLADLEGGFFSISLSDGIIGFLLINSKEILSSLLTGKYLETFLIDEILLKKNLQILSSIEWKVIVTITPFFEIKLHDFDNADISSDISLLTIILSAWKILVALFVFVNFFLFY